MTRTEIAIGLGGGIALIICIVVLAFVPWRFPWPQRHDVRGNSDHGQQDHSKSGDTFDAGGGSGD